MRLGCKTRKEHTGTKKKKNLERGKINKKRDTYMFAKRKITTQKIQKGKSRLIQQDNNEKMRKRKEKRRKTLRYKNYCRNKY